MTLAIAASPGLVGCTEPRLFTPPLRDLSDPAASFGHAVIVFAAEVLCEPLDPWEAWLVVHLGELLPDGRPRFRTALVLVARQNGKTHVLRVLSLFWQFVEAAGKRLILGMSTNLDYAREVWQAGVEQAEATPELAEAIAEVRRANGEQQMRTVDGARWKIAASTRRGGRSLTVWRLIIDELREHDSWEAWNAATKATNAVPDAMTVAISNQGDDSAVVLDSLRAEALEVIGGGEGDPRLGLFEWSAPDGCDVLDEQAWAAANPNLGHRIDVDAIRGDAVRAARQGGDEEAGFRTEVLCQRVRVLRTAVDGASWARQFVPGDLSGVRGRVALCLDVAPDGRHATLCAAAVLPDGRTRVEAVKAWESTDEVRSDLPELVGRVRPKALGWYPKGPAASLTADMAKRAGWPPAGVALEAISGDSAAVCMGFGQAVADGLVVHAADPLLDAHVLGAERLPRGDGFVFSRRGGHVDAAYAAAGAVHLARTLPPSPGKPRLIVAE